MQAGQRLPYEQHCHDLYRLYRDEENRLMRLLSQRENGRDISDAVIAEVTARRDAAKAAHEKAFDER